MDVEPAVPSPPLDFSLYLLAPGPEGVGEAIAGGVDLVQVRDKTASDPELMERTRAVMAITRAAGVPLIVNDRPDLCALVGAAGVHLGQADMPVDQARSIVGPERAIGVSTHSLEEAIRADAQDVDYIAIGPVFPTPSKEMSIEAIGPEVLGEVVAAVRAPVVAIGGITADNIDQVLAAGATRVAVIGAILGGGDPKANAEALRSRMGGSGRG